MRASTDGSRIAVVVGTRPEIIKMAQVTRLLSPRVDLIHTGQHYDHDMSGAFLNGLGLPAPALTVTGVGGTSRARQFARIIDTLGTHFTRHPPAAVLVQGDTNTAAAAAQAAHYAGVPVLHIEAGLRAHDRSMPEEINRMLVGVLADRHLAPTQQAADNLRHEGVRAEAIIVTGNTIVEATRASLPLRARRMAVLRAHGLRDESYVLATIHRPENTDTRENLHAVLAQLAKLPLPVVLPAHPRLKAAAERHHLQPDLDRLAPITPVDYPTFLALARHARLLVSDSGGVQEEATVLKRSLIVVRASTERPEAIAAGFAHLMPPGPRIAQHVDRILADPHLPDRLRATPSPYGDGLASTRIARIARTYLA